MAPSVMEIARRIRQGRMQLGLTQRQLAVRMRVSAGAVGQWESGATQPSIANRVDLSRLLKIPFIELMPEAQQIGEAALTNPVVLAIVQQVLKLPPAVQEAFLMQASAMAETLAQQSPPSRDSKDS